jgi:hypothetical protein
LAAACGHFVVEARQSLERTMIYSMASWFETLGVAALLTVRVQDLILRRREAPSRRMKH